MFMAEIKSLLLTAGHDLDLVQAPLTLDVTRGSETYILLRGTAQVAKTGDMMIADRQGIISSVVYGPDQRTQIRPETTRVVFTVYGPAGISDSAIDSHLHEIVKYARVISPAADVELLKVYPAD
jgi:DNA/RNA-binding domain of Phe-tRNA-synthetase-like protein